MSTGRVHVFVPTAVNEITQSPLAVSDTTTPVASETFSVHEELDPCTALTSTARSAGNIPSTRKTHAIRP
jgi:hypothetical protein